MDWHKYLFSNNNRDLDLDDELDTDLIEEIERMIRETFKDTHNSGKSNGTPDFSVNTDSEISVNKDDDFGWFDFEDPKKTVPKKYEKTNQCVHKDVTINSANNIRFYQCRSCKEDLGDVDG